jgi:RecA-family ATPase
MERNPFVEDPQGGKSQQKLKIRNRLKKLFIGADTLKNLEVEDQDFLVENLIPRGALCGLVGESDTGKSSFLRQLAVSLVYGDQNFLGFKLNGGCKNALYVSTEDGKAATSRWLKTHLGEGESKDEYLSQLKFVFSTDGIVENLRETVMENCIDLIIVDSYADLFEGSMNNSNEVRRFLNQYNNLSVEFGTTIIFLHHTRKSTAGLRPDKNHILGSQGFEAKMRSVMMLTKDNEDKSLRHLCVVKSNYLPEEVKSKSYVLRFNNQLSFENTGKRIDLDELVAEEWLEEAKSLKEQGKALRDIVSILQSKGHKVSKSSLQRKLS